MTNLSPVGDDDLYLLYRWSTDPSVGKTWRYRGQTPPFDVFVAQLWTGLLCHFFYRRYEGDPGSAYASLYDANLASGVAKVSVIVAPELRQGHVSVEALVELLQFGFAQWPLRKVYLECNSHSLRQFGSAVERGYFVEEARLRDYELFGDGEWSDRIYLSTDREAVRAYGERKIQNQILIKSAAHDRTLHSES